MAPVKDLKGICRRGRGMACDSFSIWARQSSGGSLHWISHASRLVGFLGQRNQNFRLEKTLSTSFLVTLSGFLWRELMSRWVVLSRRSDAILAKLNGLSSSPVLHLAREKSRRTRSISDAPRRPSRP